MNRLLLATTVLALVAIAMPVDALTTCQLTTSSAVLTVLKNGRGAYVAVDPCLVDCAFATYVYTEANGIPGLQRADDRHDDTCGGAYPADLQVW